MDVEEENGMALGAIMSIAGIFDLRDQAALLEGMRRRLEQTARDGDLQSACNLALLNTGVTLSFDLFALQTQENYKEAFDWYSSAAKRGAPRAQYHLGKMYRDGLGMDINASEAANWFYKAAMHGYPPAEAALGDLLLHGNGVPMDYAAALGWLRPAAVYGNPMARFDLGSMYLKGLGVKEDTGRAIWLIYGASLGAWSPAWDWLQQAESNPATASQVTDATKGASGYTGQVRRVDSAEGGCDEQSINSKIEE
jgi:TPR repeat protein